MSLESGLYIIKSKRSGLYVGRFPVEDLSLMPKRVLTLPPGVEAPKWVFEKRGDGNLLKANGAPTAIIDKDVLAVLLDIPPPTVWVLRPAGSENFYTIAEKDGPRRWVVESNEPEQQIKARPQGSGSHPDEEQFQIVRLDREY